MDRAEEIQSVGATVEAGAAVHDGATVAQMFARVNGVGGSGDGSEDPATENKGEGPGARAGALFIAREPASYVPMSGQGSVWITERPATKRRTFSASTAFTLPLQSTSPCIGEPVPMSLQGSV